MRCTTGSQDREQTKHQSFPNEDKGPLLTGANATKAGSEPVSFQSSSVCFDRHDKVLEQKEEQRHLTARETSAESPVQCKDLPELGTGTADGER